MKRLLRSVGASPSGGGPSTDAPAEPEKIDCLVQDVHGLNSGGNRCGREGWAVVNENGNSASLPGDNPIRDQGDDVLERTVVAEVRSGYLMGLSR